MRINRMEPLTEFSAKHTDSQRWIANWVADVRNSTWTTSHDIKTKYPSASFLAENLVIFNVKGGKYRLATRVAYRVGVVLIEWIGTHAEYNKRKF